MGEATSVTLTSDVPAIQPDAPVTPEPTQTTERPQWLPEKFKSPEDLAKAYSELESKLGKPAPKPETQESKDLAIKPTEPQKADSPSLIQKATQEWAEKGELAPETYAALEKSGMPKDLVDTYIEGQKAKAAKAADEIVGPIGGWDEFNKMAQWAGQSLDADVVAELNAALAKGGSSAKAAVLSLQAHYKANGGGPSNLIDGDPTFANVQGYRNVDEMVRDMQNPKYNEDETFREMVEAKLARSKL